MVLSIIVNNIDSIVKHCQHHLYIVNHCQQHLENCHCCQQHLLTCCCDTVTENEYVSFRMRNFTFWNWHLYKLTLIYMYIIQSYKHYYNLTHFIWRCTFLRFCKRYKQTACGRQKELLVTSNKLMQRPQKRNSRNNWIIAAHLFNLADFKIANEDER